MTRIKGQWTCRACQGDLEALFSLGNLSISTFPSTPSDGLRAPLALAKCRYCHLVQLSHTVDADTLFKHFWYESGISSTIRADLKDLATIVNKNTKYLDWVVDIGANDGTLLANVEANRHKVAFEPSQLAKKIPGDITTVNDYFSAQKWSRDFERNGWRPKVITSIAMFYDLQEPSRFIHDIARILHDDGIWINQMNYLGSMLANNCFDNIVHEHLTYWSLSALRALLKTHGLEAFKVEQIPVNGGSFRVYICQKGQRDIQDGVEDMIRAEWEAGLHTVHPYLEFLARITRQRELALNFLEKAKADDKRVFVLGAGTRGNTILQWYGITPNLVFCAVDKNSEKWGRYTPGTGIRIVSRGSVGDPDYFLLLPYSMLDEFREQEKDYLANGGKFIIPLPEFKVVD